MNNTKRLIVVLVLFVLVMVGAYFLYSALGAGVETDRLSGGSTAQGGQSDPAPVQAPDVTFYDKDGAAHQLSDYFGKPIVLNFWASWCGPCKMEMPDFEAKYRELGEDVQFLMVNMTMSNNESLEKATTYIDEEGFTFPVMYDTDGAVMITYGVTSFPTSYFIDADGYLVTRANGAITADVLQQGIDMITE